jgi:glutamine amidotransferase
MARTGARAIVTSDPMVIKDADGVILPGVGAFGAGMAKLAPMVDSIRKFISTERPLLGICLGMQLLFTTSEEMGHFDGLGVLSGTIRRFSAGKVPHIGWNQLHIIKPSPLLGGVPQDSFVYFVHSYYAGLGDFAVTGTDYGVEFSSTVSLNNLYGVQFHPEKSQRVGATILENFVRIVGEK